MSEFSKFKKAVEAKMNALTKENSILYQTTMDKDAFWELYLNSFPQGTNEVYKERREYDCTACKQFIRNIGTVVVIKPDYTTESIWNIEGLEYPYDVVAKTMAEKIQSLSVGDVYFSPTLKVGVDQNIQLLEDGTTKTWSHFYCELPKKFVKKEDEIPSFIGKLRDSKNVFLRSMQELTKDSGDIVLDLIDQGSLYRGEEHKSNVVTFLNWKAKFDSVPVELQANWAWLASVDNPVSRIRNTALGTLLIDLSEGVDIDVSVRKFEKVMAPTNYKRPTALITKGMIEKAETTIKELGYETALARRFAKNSDITVQNIIFVDRNVKPQLKKSAFDVLKEEAPVSPKSFDKIEEVSIADFVEKIVPNSTSIEVMIENKHNGNLMSLIAPENIDSKPMLKWDNNFSWSYNGDIADSIKQNVEKAGGRVDGVLRFSIQWNDNGDNNNDFDAHCLTPDGVPIYFASPLDRHSGGNLDVDIRVPGDKVAVENITFPVKSKMSDGVYEFKVHNFSHRGGTSGFSAEIEFEGQVYSYVYPKDIRNNETVIVAKIQFSKKDGIKFISQLESTTSSKEVWGVKTNQFSPVSMMMYSPNYWDGQDGRGNKHYFFILQNCKNDNKPRGFFNEFLKDELHEHRKVFEVLGSKMRVEDSDEQLSGLGFSSTQKNSIIAKVSGSFTRTVKINF